MRRKYGTSYTRRKRETKRKQTTELNKCEDLKISVYTRNWTQVLSIRRLALYPYATTDTLLAQNVNSCYVLDCMFRRIHLYIFTGALLNSIYFNSTEKQPSELCIEMNMKIALKPAESNAQPNSCDTEFALFIEPHTSSHHEKKLQFV